MQFIMLIYPGETFAALSNDEKNRVHRACGEWHEQLLKSGRSVGATGLQPKETATTLRQNGGKIDVVDGPFAETKEVLGGFELLECRDLDEALGIAKRFPGLPAGCGVELRPVVEGGNCEE